MKITVRHLLAGIVLGCHAMLAYAVTLSDIELRSFLNQPLDARVQIDNISPDELESLAIEFARNPDSDAGADAGLVIKVVNDKSGKYIQISSRQPVREPVVTFTLELSWSTGRMQREYSLLLDPKN
jgi:pilus assembly protein FimV